MCWSCLRAALILGLILGPARVAQADQLDGEPAAGEAGFRPLQELSYEAIIDGDNSSDAEATLHLRVALHNSASSPRDFVLALALPQSAELEAVALAKDGIWHPAVATTLNEDGSRRDPGTVWVRTLAADRAGRVPMAEVVGFGVDPDTTWQVELTLRVEPTLRAGRWQLELPSRGAALDALAPDRRVIVRNLPAGQGFAVDDTPSGAEPVIMTDPASAVVVRWPAKARRRGALQGRYDVFPGPPGFDDGRFRISLRPGHVGAPTPQHVVFLIDRSRSTSPELAREAAGVVDRLIEQLPERTTFDVLGFARTAAPLLTASPPWLRADDQARRAELRKTLQGLAQAQGTDLQAALELAARRIRQRSAKQTLVIIITDGMVPSQVVGADLRRDLVGALQGHRAPELLFLIDDPLVARSGLEPDHPIAMVAAALGARISLASLAETRQNPAELLAAPRILGDLAVDLPPNMALDAALPSGLVAGNVAVQWGHYQGEPADRIRVRGRIGARKLARTLRGQGAPRPAEALAATLWGDTANLAVEGFAHPPWHDADLQRQARASVTQGSRRREYFGRLDQDIVRNYLTTRVLPRARVCYNHGLMRHPDQAGRVVLEMEVGKGEVMVAQAAVDGLRVADPTLEACLTEAAWALDIPAGLLDDRIYLLRYPLRLVAPSPKDRQGHIDSAAEAPPADWAPSTGPRHSDQGGPD